MTTSQTDSGDEAPDTDTDGEGISDEKLPDDLRPGDDNPLAEPLEPGEEVEGMSAPDAPDAADSAGA